MKEYIVLEICKDTEGKISPAVYTYEDIKDARALFYNKCATAVKSDYLVHSVVLMNSAGNTIEMKSFRHEPAATTPVEETPEEVG